MNAQLEQEIQAKRLNAPRVTPEHIESVIYREWYFTGEHGVEGASSRSELVCRERETDTTDPTQNVPSNQSLARLTFCVLLLRNGTTVTGESACVSAENFDAEIGRKVARQKAIEKIYPLEGYLLREKLSEGGA